MNIAMKYALSFANDAKNRLRDAGIEDIDELLSILEE